MPFLEPRKSTMPRIDPIQLLNCLSVLLSEKGGIKSRDEVARLAGLMTKFSKKLVSKCIYIQILKCTETELLGSFMGSGGWILVHMWLTESIVSQNWPLARELLELLLLCPVDIERLKTNNCPKLVKELSKDGNHFAIRALASKLVEQWLKTVKGEQVVPILLSDIPQILKDAHSDVQPESVKIGIVNNSKNEEISAINTEKKPNTEDQEKVTHSENKIDPPAEVNDIKSTEDGKEEQEVLPVLKISMKNGKQIVSQVDESVNKTSEDESSVEKSRERSKSKNKEKSSEKRSHSSKSSSSKHSSKSHSSSDKHKSSHKSSSSSSKDSRHSSSKDRSKDKDRQSSSHSSKSKSDSNKKSSSSSSSSKSKEDRKPSSERDKSRSKEKDDKSEKSKDNSKSTEKDDDKPQSPSIHKLGKIPRLSDVKKEKPSISIEVRKPDEPKPKTVKTFHSKFRKHGLEEEVKPPPSRAALSAKKTPPPATPPVPLPKRPSPVRHETPAPPEKKPKIVEPQEKPGSIKLIPAKPKPMMLLESGMFMDALNAATSKKEPKKRKRRTSGSKDGNPQNEGSPPHTPTTITSPTSENKSVPPRFYQDTLEEDKEKVADKSVDNIEDTDPAITENGTDEKMDTSEPHTLTINGLKGVLCYHKRKGPKKSIKWKPDSELEEIQYFELDETERVNVTKTFTDMKHLERIHEREAFQKARNLINDDVMEEKTNWKPLILVNVEGQVQVEHGKNSKEKEIQAIRQKGTLQPLYFHKSMIPDSPFEPDPETHPYTEPTTIPLEDLTGNQDNISDFRNMPWPEPKGNPPAATANLNMTPLFPPNINQFPNGFPNPQFPGMPGFQGPPGMVPPDWANGLPPPNMLPPNGMPGPMAAAPLAPGAIPPGNMPPGMMMPPDNMLMNPEMFGAPNPMFPMPPEGFNMQQNMFPMDFNMSGPPGPDGFAGPGGFRGAMRGRGVGGLWRGKGAPGWDALRGRGGGARGARKTVCMYFQRKGSCRQGDNCLFLHPGVNCPF